MSLYVNTITNLVGWQIQTVLRALIRSSANFGPTSGLCNIQGCRSATRTYVPPHFSHRLAMFGPSLHELEDNPEVLGRDNYLAARIDAESGSSYDVSTTVHFRFLSTLPSIAESHWPKHIQQQVACL